MTLTTDINQERRLTARVEKQWRICSRASFPRRCDIDRVKFGNDWQYCFMVDLSDSILESRFSYVGTGLKEEFGQLILDRQRIGEIAAGSLLELAAKAIQNVNEKKLPVATSGKAVHEGEEILYRAVLLPLSESGLIIDGVLGAIGYRAVVG